MKANVAHLSLILALGLASAATAHAHEDYSEAGTNHWLSHVAANGGAPTANQLAPYGYPASRSPEREVTLAAGSESLNVSRMETVRIKVAGKSLTWTFDTLGTAPFALSRIAPEAAGVTVYVAENPAVLGG